MNSPPVTTARFPRRHNLGSAVLPPLSPSNPPIGPHLIPGRHHCWLAPCPFLCELFTTSLSHLRAHAILVPPSFEMILISTHFPGQSRLNVQSLILLTFSPSQALAAFSSISSMPVADAGRKPWPARRLRLAPLAGPQSGEWRKLRRNAQKCTENHPVQTGNACLAGPTW